MDLYQLLDVAPLAGAPELRAAWARTFAASPPDEAPREFLSLWAFQTLADPMTRAAYDELREGAIAATLAQVLDALHRKDLGAYMALESLVRQVPDSRIGPVPFRAFLDNAFGLIYLTTDQPARAETTLEALVRTVPQNPHFLVNWGRALLAVGRTTEGEAKLLTAAKLDVRERETFRALVDHYLATAQPAKAIQILEGTIPRPEAGAPPQLSDALDVYAAFRLAVLRLEAGAARAAVELAARIAPLVDQAEDPVLRRFAASRLEQLGVRLEAVGDADALEAFALLRETWSAQPPAPALPPPEPAPPAAAPPEPPAQAPAAPAPVDLAGTPDLGDPGEGDASRATFFDLDLARLGLLDESEPEAAPAGSAALAPAPASDVVPPDVGDEAPPTRAKLPSGAGTGALEARMALGKVEKFPTTLLALVDALLVSGAGAPPDEAPALRQALEDARAMLRRKPRSLAKGIRYLERRLPALYGLNPDAFHDLLQEAEARSGERPAPWWRRLLPARRG